MLDALEMDILDTVHVYMNTMAKSNIQKQFVDLMLKGTGNIDVDKTLFLYVHVYKNDNNRF